MLDTVRIKGPWPLLQPQPPGRWLLLPEPQRCIRFRTDVTGRDLQLVECSLPRLLRGSNGYVLENQQQLDAALQLLRQGLLLVAVTPPASEFRPTRVDIAWNFDRPARPIIVGHQHKLLPGLRRGATMFPDETGIAFGSASGAFGLRMYDKCAEMRVAGSILRVELVLRTPEIAKRLPDGAWMCFSSLWEQFRKVLAGIPVSYPASQAGSWIGPLYRRASKEVADAVLEDFLVGLAPRTRRKYNQMRDAAKGGFVEEFSWDKYLPVDAPPAAVTVHKLRRSPVTASRRGIGRKIFDVSAVHQARSSKRG